MKDSNLSLSKAIICGGRDFSPTLAHLRFLHSIVERLELNLTAVLSGCAKGGDSWGEIWAACNGLDIEFFPANWEKYGKSAGFIRNKEMVEEADMVFAFPGGKGTKHTKDLAKKKGIPVYEIE